MKLPKVLDVEDKMELINPPTLKKKDLDQRPVLVIEDDHAAADLIERILNKDGYQVIKASNGVDGLELAKLYKPFVITLDLMIPRKNGWYVLKELKGDPELKKIPVIVISVLDNLEVGYTLGADSYLTKPIQKEQLIKTIENCISTIDKEDRPILIVDDDKNVQQVFSRILSKEGWQTEIADNGKQGLELVQKRPPALILLDIIMPTMNGFEFMEKLKDLDPDRKIPVIVVTARTLSSEEKNELKHNVSQIVQKGSYDMNELMDRVRNLVNQVKTKVH